MTAPHSLLHSQYERKLNTIRSLSSRRLNKVVFQNNLLATQQLHSATNDYIQQCVSVMMEIPLKAIRHQRKTAAACNARMICFYVLKSTTGLSYRQIADLYEANVSLVHRLIKRMDFYYWQGCYKELNIIVDLVNLAVQEKISVIQYEQSNGQTEIQQAAS